MRTYRLEIRLIQVAASFAILVVIAGFLGLWGQSAKAPIGITGNGVDVQEAANNAAQPPNAQEVANNVAQPPNAQEAANNVTQPPNVTKIVALGDSFTLGYPLDAAQSWPKRMGDVLKVTVVNKGQKTQNSKDLLSRFDADVVAEKPGRVIIFAGIGDALQGVPVKEVQANIEEMVRRARTNNIIPVLALPIAYPGAQQNIKDTRAWELSYAQQENIMILDFTSVLYDAAGKYKSGLSKDGTYPTAKGYETMGDYAAQVLK